MADVEYTTSEGTLEIKLIGRLDTHTVADMWNPVLKEFSKESPEKLVIDAGQVEYCDSSGAALMMELENSAQKSGGDFEIRNLSQDFQHLLQVLTPEGVPWPAQKTSMLRGIFITLGQQCEKFKNDFMDLIAFTGELAAKTSVAIRHPRQIRYGECWVIAERVGADAVGINSLLGFLIGMILAFQSAIPMQKFGADIFVADLVVISMFRELGPLLTAFVVAARSGSAFAAEIGTMKVNEELDALTTMGIDPVKFLVIPRMLASIVVLPLLTMFNLLLSLVGAGLVMNSFGYTPLVFYNQIRNAASLGDLFGGLFKTLVFGLLIASIGCLRGLQTGSGASAVGDSATKAVVTSIVAIVFADGIFSVVFYYLGI